jgi:DNA-binding transcriptional regulator YdaS (Cro superfamily)
MDTETPIGRAIRLAGGPAAMARGLNESVQTISNWAARGQPPANRCAAIEALTGVSRRDLRTDWRDYWPEPTGTEGAPEVAAPSAQQAA